MNRRGRVSPLPQAVQGAQSQIHGPAGEPSIKSEFGRMYVGIGNGVGMGLSSPITSGAALPFSNGNGGPGGAGASGGVPLRREDSDSTPHDSNAADPPAKPVKGKRRKAAKDDPAKAAAGEDDGSGRATPAGKTKRAKTTHHHHQYAPKPLLFVF